jgi:hypothetical protein
VPAEVIASLDQVTPGWLTAVLLNDQALTAGAVSGFDVDAGRGNWSANAVLKLRYTADARGTLPARLFLKLVDAGDDSDGEFFGRSEVTYYTHDYVDVDDAPIIHCYDAAFSDQLRRYHLLLDDVSLTHVEAAEKEPTLEYGLALAEGLAALHARWWGADRLAQAGAPRHDAGHIRRFVTIAEPGARHIIDAFSAQLQPGWPDLMRTLYARHPQALVLRAADASGFTLIHGDAGHNNVLVPRQGNRPIYIIDRQPFDWSLTTWLGAYDLAYAMVLDWPVKLRRRLELPVLRRYYQQLIHRGIEAYDWQQLFDDYRLCVAMGVYIASEYCRGGINQRRLPVWLPMLQRSLTAIEDLHCAELR